MVVENCRKTSEGNLILKSVTVWQCENWLIDFNYKTDIWLSAGGSDNGAIWYDLTDLKKVDIFTLFYFLLTQIHLVYQIMRRSMIPDT